MKSGMINDVKKNMRHLRERPLSLTHLNECGAHTEGRLYKVVMPLSYHIRRGL